jgi:hypothetical protein
MPRVRPRRNVVRPPLPEPQPQRFQFTEAVCVEGFSSGWSNPIARGRVYPREHPMVRMHPEFWRLLGPRPDAEGV